MQAIWCLKFWNMYTLICSEKFGQHWRRRDEERCVAECCFSRTMHLLAHHLKNWLPSKMLDSNYLTINHICQIWLQMTTICFLNWMNSWKDANLMTIITLLAQQMAFRQWNPTFGEMLDQVMLKSDKIWCAYLLINCVILETFWMPLVCKKWNHIHNHLWPLHFSANNTSFHPFKPMGLSAHRQTHKSENGISSSFTPFTWRI